MKFLAVLLCFITFGAKADELMFICTSGLWAQSLKEIYKCRVKIVSATGIPGNDNIYVTVSGTPEALKCVQNALETSSHLPPPTPVWGNPK